MSPSNSNSLDNAYYRPCVGAMLFNNKGQVWLGKRIADPNKSHSYAWQMPQGGIDLGEDPADAVMRELMEETGTDRVQIYRRSVHWFSYDLPKNLLRNDKNFNFKGQTQKWFALRFNGTDSDFNLNTYERPEFSEWCWANLNDVTDLIVPFKRDVYMNVVNEFKDIPLKISNE
jgi:putative (di)nucleoside polyphosphate hydrolase